MSSPARAFAILDLFSRERPVWSPDEINAALGYSRPTGYRYVKDLVDAGLLRKVAAGHYALGARIIELDYQLRQSDPVLLAAAPVMQRLAQASGFDAVLSVLYPGPRVIDVHRASGEPGLELVYGRGRPRPVFVGAAPKVLLAHQPRSVLVRLHADHATEIAASGMGDDWPSFRQALTEIRRLGWYRSRGELQTDVGAIAVPVLDTEGHCTHALALVGSLGRLQSQDDAQLQGWLVAAVNSFRDANTA